MQLNGKVALVLGAIKGIGKGIALALAGQGVKVAIPIHDWREHLPALEADLAATGQEHLIIDADLLETAHCEALVGQVIDRFGRLDILINNIERGGWPVVHGPYIQDQWDLELATTLRAKRWVFDAALPHLKATGKGCVINISSVAGMVGRAGPARHIFNDGYAAANRAVGLLTETWARLGAPEVRVNELMLGFVETRHGDQTRGWALLSEEQKGALLAHTLLERTGTIGDVVETVLFMVKAAGFMTGSRIRLDGGYVLGGEEVGPMPDGVL
jgi:3-oxoacyl-[acyl-carrier protein] reductase